jgi:hypothetical protein
VAAQCRAWSPSARYLRVTSRWRRRPPACSPHFCAVNARLCTGHYAQDRHTCCTDRRRNAAKHCCPARAIPQRYHCRCGRGMQGLGRVCAARWATTGMTHRRNVSCGPGDPADACMIPWCPAANGRVAPMNLEAEGAVAEAIPLNSGATVLLQLSQRPFGALAQLPANLASTRGVWVHPPGHGQAIHDTSVHGATCVG